MNFLGIVNWKAIKSDRCALWMSLSFATMVALASVRNQDADRVPEK